MKIVIAIIAVALAVTAFTASASAKSSYTWPSYEKRAMVNDLADAFEYKLKYPYLYADCMQKSAAQMYRSYDAYLYASDASFNRWTKTPSYRRCFYEYGDRIFD